MTTEQRINGALVKLPVRTDYDEFYDKESGYDDNYTWGEVVWRAAVIKTWEKVFQIVSDRPDLVTREHIKRLEAARDADGAGPLSIELPEE